MKKYLALACSVLLLTACNGGGGGEVPSPSPSPTPSPSTEPQFSVSVSQQTTDQGVVNWVDLRKVGSHSNFMLTIKNTGAIPAVLTDITPGKYSGGVSITSPASQGVNFAFIDNSSDLNSCMNYSLKSCTYDANNIPTCSNESAMLQPGQSCNLSVYAGWSINTSQSSTYSVPVTVGVQTNETHQQCINPQGCTQPSDFVNVKNRYSLSTNSIQANVTPSILITDQNVLSITHSYGMASLNGFSNSGLYGLSYTGYYTSSRSVTRYNLNYNVSTGLTASNPITWTLPVGCGGTLYGNYLTPDGSQAVSYCYDVGIEYLYSFTGNVATIVNSSLTFPTLPIQGSNNILYGASATSNPSILNNNVWNTTNLTNGYGKKMYGVDTNGNYLFYGSNLNSWQCLNNSNSLSQLQAPYLTTNELQLNYQTGINIGGPSGLFMNSHFESNFYYSDGTINNLISYTGLFNVNTNNCSLSNSNYLLQGAADIMNITSNYVILKNYNGSFYVNSINDLYN